MAVPVVSIEGPLRLVTVPESVSAEAATMGLAGKPAVAVKATATTIPNSLASQNVVKVACSSAPVAIRHQSAQVQSEPTSTSPTFVQPV